MISSSAGLDVSKVYFLLWTGHEFQDQLFKHAIARLAKAGLFPIHDRTHKQGEAVLKVIIEASPVTGLPGKVMYKRSLELYENVFTERTPPARVWTVTWSGGIPEGFRPTEQALRALKARKRQALSHQTYLSFLSSHRAHTISRLCAYAVTRVRLAKARGMSLRSDGETVSNGLSVYPTCCATQSVGICSMAIL